MTTVSSTKDVDTPTYYTNRSLVIEKTETTSVSIMLLLLYFVYKCSKSLNAFNCVKQSQKKTFGIQNRYVFQMNRLFQSVPARTIPHLQFTGWTNKNAVPSSASEFCKFVQDVDDLSKASPDGGPIFIICM